MKRLYILLILMCLFTSSYAQDIDTLLVLKKKAVSYINHKLAKPRTYVPQQWSAVSQSDDNLTLAHAFKAKNLAGKLVQFVYTFNFASDLELISVNTDSPAKQIKDARLKIKQAEDEIKRIKDTRDRKIEALTDSR
jgi:hypothetical protein